MIHPAVLRQIESACRSMSRQQYTEFLEEIYAECEARLEALQEDAE